VLSCLELVICAVQHGYSDVRGERSVAQSVHVQHAQGVSCGPLDLGVGGDCSGARVDAEMIKYANGGERAYPLGCDVVE